MAAQKFTLPTMPFRREVHNGCAIGTSILINAKPFQDNNKGFLVQLSSASDIALNMSVPVNKQKKMTVTARINDQYTSEIEKEVYLPYNKPFVLHIRLNTHVCEIYLNDQHLLDFVHRVNPLEIKEVSIEGPLIVDEVVFRPPQGASLNELPAYNEVAEHTLPVSQMQNLSLGSSSSRRNGAPEPPAISSMPTANRAVPPYTPSAPPTTLPYPMNAGKANTKPYPYPEKGSSYDPSKSEKVPYGSAPVAQVAPQQPPAPGLTNIGLVNAAALSTRPQGPQGGSGSNLPYPPAGSGGPRPNPAVSQPGGYSATQAGYQNRPADSRPSQQYPVQTSGTQSSSYSYGAPASYNNPPPQQGYPPQPAGMTPNAYPQYPGTSYPAPNAYQQPAYNVYPQPVYQQPAYPYVAPTMYPGYYSYGGAYYDDCHHHHHHC